LANDGGEELSNVVGRETPVKKVKVEKEMGGVSSIKRRTCGPTCWKKTRFRLGKIETNLGPRRRKGGEEGRPTTRLSSGVRGEKHTNGTWGKKWHNNHKGKLGRQQN